MVHYYHPLWHAGNTRRSMYGQLENLDQEAHQFRLDINWARTTIQTPVDPCQTLDQCSHDIIWSRWSGFMGSPTLVHMVRSMVATDQQHIVITRECINTLHWQIRTNSIWLNTKLSLFKTRVPPVLLYRGYTLMLTKHLKAKLHCRCLSTELPKENTAHSLHGSLH